MSPMNPPISMPKLAPPSAAATPYRNRTTSEPSRSTAIVTTRASAASDFDPSTTAAPAARISAASSRPCRAIHTLCQPSISTANPRMHALNSSWPLPWNSCDNPLVKTATMQAPSTPALTPPTIQRMRPATPVVTANTMPMIKPASNTSRKTITRLGSTATSRHDACCSTIDDCPTRDSWHDQETLRRAMKIIEEIISARLERPYVQDRFAARWDHLLDVQRVAFE